MGNPYWRRWKGVLDTQAIHLCPPQSQIRRLNAGIWPLHTRGFSQPFPAYPLQHISNTSLIGQFYKKLGNTKELKSSTWREPAIRAFQPMGVCMQVLGNRETRNSSTPGNTLWYAGGATIRVLAEWGRFTLRDRQIVLGSFSVDRNTETH